MCELFGFRIMSQRPKRTNTYKAQDASTSHTRSKRPPPIEEPHPVDIVSESEDTMFPNVNLALLWWHHMVKTVNGVPREVPCRFDEWSLRPNYARFYHMLCGPKSNATWVRDAYRRHKYLKRASLTLEAKLMFRLINCPILPTTNDTERMRNEGNRRLLYPSLLTQMLCLAFVLDNYGVDFEILHPKKEYDVTTFTALKGDESASLTTGTKEHPGLEEEPKLQSYEDHNSVDEDGHCYTIFGGTSHVA
ncbi:hypothetical protein RND71_005749 [Anisodus tanguticus]|uniref:Uncharacterized protein n=1 Tax=Anisodus tanguticus TaxID=243964 RepID=A0AAE1SS57_9SOLA|nr:hypothetical protein RND71_005749 [Anisodus tanguticus]